MLNMIPSSLKLRFYPASWKRFVLWLHKLDTTPYKIDQRPVCSLNVFVFIFVFVFNLSGHVFSSLWSNVSEVTSIEDRSLNVFSKCICQGHLKSKKKEKYTRNKVWIRLPALLYIIVHSWKVRWQSYLFWPPSTTLLLIHVEMI